MKLSLEPQGSDVTCQVTGKGRTLMRNLHGWGMAMWLVALTGSAVADTTNDRWIYVPGLTPE